MSNTRSIEHWLDEYGESHQNATNELIHWICVPTIFFCVIGLLASIPTPTLPILGPMPIAKIAVGLVLYFYLTRSLTLMVGMAIWCILCLWLAGWLATHAPWPLWAISLLLFTIAWIGQFVGHRIEGKKPTFLRDIQFLLIGPAWLMSKLYAKLGIKV